MVRSASVVVVYCCFFFNDTATTEIYTLSLHDALPIYFDGKTAKILTVSGGRIITDFNNPLAGKIVIYKIKVLRTVLDINEKAKALIEFLFKKDLFFRIEEKKIIIEVEKELVKFVELFKEKFKDILGLDLEVKENTEEIDKKMKEGKKDNEISDKITDKHK